MSLKDKLREEVAANSHGSKFISNTTIIHPPVLPGPPAWTAAVCAIDVVDTDHPATGVRVGFCWSSKHIKIAHGVDWVTDAAKPTKGDISYHTTMRRLYNLLATEKRRQLTHLLHQILQASKRRLKRPAIIFTTDTEPTYAMQSDRFRPPQHQAANHLLEVIQNCQNRNIWVAGLEFGWDHLFQSVIRTGFGIIPEELNKSASTSEDVFILTHYVDPGNRTALFVVPDDEKNRVLFYCVPFDPEEVHPVCVSIFHCLDVNIPGDVELLDSIADTITTVLNSAPITGTGGPLVQLIGAKTCVPHPMDEALEVAFVSRIEAIDQLDAKRGGYNE